MNTSKIILGIGITILGGAVMLISMIFGIIQYSGSLYENIQVFGIELPSPPAALKTSLFTIEENQIISVWLKYPDRRIENKDFKISPFPLWVKTENSLQNLWKISILDIFGTVRGKGNIINWVSMLSKMDL